MKKKEEIMMEHCSDNGLLSMALGKSILAAMEEYAQQQVKLFATPDVSNEQAEEVCDVCGDSGKNYIRIDYKDSEVPCWNCKQTD